MTTTPQPDAFEYHPGGGKPAISFVVVERILPEDYERKGDRRTAYIMRHHKIATIIYARRRRGQVLFQFYEMSDGSRHMPPSEKAKL